MLPLAASAYDVVLAIHVSAVVVAFGVTFAYPVFGAVMQGYPVIERAAFHRAQHTVGRRVITPGLVVIVGAGAYLASDGGVWGKLWVQVPLGIAIVLGGLAGAFFAPRERRLGELAEKGGGEDYERLVKQVAAGSALASALVLVAIFFMTLKPGA